MNKEKFIKTLDVLRFPDIKQINNYDIDAILSIPELKDFFEYLCTLNEDNVLTIHELEGYQNISETLRTSEVLDLDEEDDWEQNVEYQYLQDYLININKRSELLQSQKQLLKEQKSSLSIEKAKCEEINKSIRKQYDDYRQNKVPNSEIQMFSSLKTLQEFVTELKLVVSDSNDKNIMPTLDVKNLEEYFDEEENILLCMNDYIKNNFQFTDETMTLLNIPALFNDKLIKEMNILNKSLNKSKLAETHAICMYKKKLAHLNFLKQHQEENNDYITQCSSSQISIKLNEEKIMNEKLSKKEEMLMASLSNAVRERLEAQCSRIALACSKEVFECYKHNLEKISFPYIHLLNQRARLQLLISFINLNKRNLKSIQSLVNDVLSFTESGLKACHTRMEQYEDSLKEVKSDGLYLEPDSIMSSACTILNEVQHQDDLPLVKLADLVEAIECLLKKIENKKQEKENKMNLVTYGEKQYLDLEKYLIKGIDFLKFMNLQWNFSIQLNQLEVVWRKAGDDLIQFEKEWLSKKKVLDSNRNMLLSRSLFVFALLEEEKFANIIEKIKTAKEYITDT